MLMYVHVSRRVGICEIKRTREASILSQFLLSRISMVLRLRKSTEEFMSHLYAIRGTPSVAIGTVVSALIRLLLAFPPPI